MLYISTFLSQCSNQLRFGKSEVRKRILAGLMSRLVSGLMSRLVSGLVSRLMLQLASGMGVVCLIVLISSGELFGQLQKEQTRKLVVGSNFGSFGFQSKGVYPTYQKEWAVGYQVEPYVGVFVKQSLALGVIGSYGDLYSNVLELDPFYDFGYWGRYYIPLKGEGRRSNPALASQKNRVLPFVQLAHVFGNSYFDRDTDEQVVSSTPNIQRISPSVGIDLKLKGNLYLEAAIRQQYYLNAPARHNLLGGSLGLNYIIDPVERQKNLKRSIEKKHRRELKYEGMPGTRFIPFNRLVLGTNLTYIWDVASLNGAPMRGSMFHELSWHLNAATPVTRRARIGFNYIKQVTRDPFNGSNKFYMAGPFLQYNLLRNVKAVLSEQRKVQRFFVELGGYKGNYCTCDPDNPFKVEGLRYLGIGLGMDVRINKLLHLDLGFTNYNILNKQLGKYNYTQYIIGLDLHVFNWKKEAD